MTPAERERAAVVAFLDVWARAAGGSATYARGWGESAFNAARQIERGDHLPATSLTGIPLTRRRP